MDAVARLKSLGLALPTPPNPGGAYEAVHVQGGVAYVAIQFPVVNGEWRWRGRLGREISTRDGYEAARACAMNVLAQLQLRPGLDRIVGLNRVEASMLVADGWEEFAKVLDGASHLFLEVLGDRGRHARSLAGVARLPRDVPIALTVTATIDAPRGGQGSDDV
jgi:enamine deaminase RidA (YjgF/YER057c/UK114 family)